MSAPVTDPGELVEQPLWGEECDRRDEARQAQYERDICMYCGEYESGCDGECGSCFVQHDALQERRADQ